MSTHLMCPWAVRKFDWSIRVRDLRHHTGLDHGSWGWAWDQGTAGQNPYWFDELLEKVSHVILLTSSQAFPRSLKI